MELLEKSLLIPIAYESVTENSANLMDPHPDQFVSRAMLEVRKHLDSLNYSTQVAQIEQIV